MTVSNSAASISIHFEKKVQPLPRRSRYAISKVKFPEFPSLLCFRVGERNSSQSRTKIMDVIASLVDRLLFWFGLCLELETSVSFPPE